MSNRVAGYKPGIDLAGVNKERGLDVNANSWSNNGAADLSSGIITPATSGIPAEAQGKDESMGYDCKADAGTPDRGGAAYGDQGALVTPNRSAPFAGLGGSAPTGGVPMPGIPSAGSGGKAAE